MKILITIFLLCFTFNSYAKSEICFIGATPNFFKAGHSAIREIATHYPKAHMRLGLISEVKETPPIVQDLEESGKLSFHTWPLGDDKKVKSSIFANEEITAEMEALVKFFQGCTAAFLVPPIDGRVEIGSKYAKAISLAKVPYAVVLGVQYSSKTYREKYAEEPPQISLDAEELYEAMDDIFKKYSSPIKYIVLHLPMFLENILYQTERLRHHKAFYWPLNRDAKFAFITCKDLGKLVAHGLVEFEDLLFKCETANNSHSDRRFDISLIGGITNAAQLESYFREIVDTEIAFKEQAKESFIKELKLYLGKSESGANTIAELYEEIRKGRDLLDLDSVVVDIGYPKPQAARDWIQEHRECFLKDGSNKFPLPPSSHQAPIPEECDTLLDASYL